jgi:glucose 1-dehydrogenase
MADRAGVRREGGQGLGNPSCSVGAHTVVVKAWEHIAAIGRRTFWDPKTVLVTGAGPIVLLAALIAKQVGGDVHVLDRATGGRKPALVEALGATYHTGPVSELGLRSDIFVECTGVAPLIRAAAESVAPGGIICRTVRDPARVARCRCGVPGGRLARQR